MPGGTIPQYIAVPKVGITNNVTAANISKDLTTGTLNRVLFESNTTNGIGSYLDHIRAKPHGTNIATVARFFLNKGGDTTIAANNTLFLETTLPATNAVATGTTGGLSDVLIPIKMPIPPSYNVHVLLGTAVASGWKFSAFGGDY